MTWITTHSGRVMNLLDPQPEQICIEDIAHSLAYLCRFTGHTSTHYSVAQHSVIVSRNCPPDLRLKGLLHDAHEAYIGDWSTPLKESFSSAVRAELRSLEARLMAAIAEAVGVDLHHDPRVKYADRVALRAEVELLLPEPIHGFADLPGERCENFTPWAAGVAENVFLRTFRRLMQEVEVNQPELALV